MKTAFIATVAALASFTSAAPTHPKLQASILTLEMQILEVIDSITQSTPDLKANYVTGVRQFGVLANKLSGPLPCAPFVPGNPTDKETAIEYLQTSQESLTQLALDLQDPANTVAASAFHGDICQALDYYAGVATFVAGLKTSAPTA